MNLADEAQRLARTYVWWEEPAETLARPHKLLCQILRFARPEDYVVAQQIWGEAALKQALLEALPGEIDPKAESFWRLRLGLPEGQPSARHIA